MPDGSLQPVQQPLMMPPDPNTGLGGFSLPAALLAQYPALQNIDWAALAQQQGAGMMDDDEGELSDMGQRTSFDASSQGEYFDEENENPYNGQGHVDYATGQQHVY